MHHKVKDVIIEQTTCGICARLCFPAKERVSVHRPLSLNLSFQNAEKGSDNPYNNSIRGSGSQKDLLHASGIHGTNLTLYHREAALEMEGMSVHPHSSVPGFQDLSTAR